MISSFEGVRVLDLTAVVSGPLCTYHLAMCGADVVKIEPPGVGDLARKMGADIALNHQLMGVTFLAMNAGKKSVTLNLKHPRGKALFQQLVKGADVVVENFRPGTMKSLGLDYEVLRQINPAIIYCAISGFGQTGPLASRLSYDQIIQGFCGLMSVTGTAATAPNRAGYIVCDTTAAVSGAFAIASALYRCAKTGTGAFIDLSMLDVALATMAQTPVSNYLNAGIAPEPMGNENPTASPSGTYKTADGVMNVVNNEQKQFEALARAMEMPELVSNTKFATRDARVENRVELRVVLEAKLSTRGTEHWEKLLTEARVPVGPVMNLPQILEHPQTLARQTVKWMDNIPGIDRKVAATRLGFLYGEEPPDTLMPPPRLGADNDTILRDLGYSTHEIAEFRRDHVI